MSVHDFRSRAVRASASEGVLVITLHSNDMQPGQAHQQVTSIALATRHAAARRRLAHRRVVLTPHSTAKSRHAGGAPISGQQIRPAPLAPVLDP